MFLGISFYQIILGVIALLFLINGFLKFAKKKRDQSFLKFLLTIIIWGGILVFAAFPEATHSISRKLGMGENLNTLIFTGFVLIFIVLFKLINIIERMERNISEIVRREALKKIKDG